MDPIEKWGYSSQPMLENTARAYQFFWDSLDNPKKQRLDPGKKEGFG